MSKINFEIGGIHCPSCKMLITDILADEKIKVTKFDVDIKKQKGLLSVDSIISSDEIIQIIKSAGDYKVTLK